MKSKSLYSLSEELLIRPYKKGINLIKPSKRDNKQSYSIAKLNQLPISTFFLDTESRVVCTNEVTIELAGRKSLRDTLGRNAEDFFSKEFAKKLLANDEYVIKNASMRVIEETGLRNDDCLMQAMSIKLPWYHENKVIGLLGLSITIDPYSLPNFAGALSQLISTGLIGQSQSFTKPILLSTGEKINFTKREYAILSQLIRGKTAREIAEYFHLSIRTIEHYFEKIKIKSDCKSKSEIIDKFFDEFKYRL